MIFWGRDFMMSLGIATTFCIVAFSLVMIFQTLPAQKTLAKRTSRNKEALK